MTLISRPSIPEVVFERIKSDLVEFAFNFFQDGVSLDVAARTYKTRLKASGLQVLDKATTTNASGRVTFALTNPEKAPLAASEYQLLLVEILAGGVEKTLMSGTLRWSVAVGKTTGQQAPADVSVNYITATQELMVALGVVDFGSLSSGLSAAAAAASAGLAADLATEVSENATIVAENAEIVAGSAELVVAKTAETTAAAAAAQQDRILTEQAKDDVLNATTGTFASSGGYDASTGIATFAETGATQVLSSVAGLPNGGFWDITKPGNRAIAIPPGGTEPAAVDMLVGGKLSSTGTKYIYIPPKDTGFEKVQQLGAVLTPNEYPEAIFPIVDLLDKLLMQFDLDGSFFAPKYRNASIAMSAFKDFVINYGHLSEETKGYMMRTLDPLTGFIWGVFDLNDRILIACRTNGQIYIPNLDFTLLDGSVVLSKLDPSLQLQITAGSVNLNNRMHAGQDNLIRSKMMSIGFRTSTYGALFKRLPSHDTSGITFLNNSGTALDIRKATGLDFRGIKRIGNYDVPAVTEGTYKGLSSVSPSTVGLLAGDYYKIGVSTSDGTITIDGSPYATGDLAVYNGSAFVKKAAPSPTTGSLAGHWWNVTTAGVFDGVSYAVGDIIYLLSVQSSGGPYFRHFFKNRTGEYFYGGEFAPGSFAAPTTVENCVFMAASAGTFDSKVFAKGDMLVRKAGAWAKLASQQIVTVAPGEIFSQACDKTGDFEIKRADSSDAPASIFIDAKSQFVPMTTTKDLVAYCDSFGGTLAGLAAANPGRTVTVRSYGGAKSEEILSMQEYEVLRSNDLFKGRMSIYIHGQNNSNVNQVIESAIGMVQVNGARDKHFLFLSVLGARNFSTHNGTRFVCPLLEDAFAGVASNFLVTLENFYENYVPGNYLNMRKIILASAVGRTGKDITFPGMSEEQVAATYGITPISYHFNFDTAPFNRETINYLGTHALTAAPTGGNDNDYYLSTHADHRGNWWVKVAGTWTRFNPDTVHVQDNAKAIYVSSVTNWLTTNKL